MSLELAERPAARHAAVIQATLNYLGPVEGRPFTYAYPPPDGQPRSNIMAAPHRVAIRDLRLIAGQVSLGREGYALACGASALRDLADEVAIRAIYYLESARIPQAPPVTDRPPLSGRGGIPSGPPLQPLPS
ncbi:hypothetical protein [Dankookia sp. P2]|uniref:hypothetical protein n=1 Tax=Dankookia sp. P2 TaxID=3423955 RepID=UPI003D66D489